MIKKLLWQKSNCFLNSQKSIENKKGVKGFLKKADETEQILLTKLKQIEKLQFGDTAFYEGGSFYIADTALSEKLKVKPQKGESHRESLRLFQEGKTIAEIATERSMAESTIEGHLSQFIATGEVDIYHFLSKEDIEDIQIVYQLVKVKGYTLQGAKEIVNKRYKSIKNKKCFK